MLTQEDLHSALLRGIESELNLDAKQGDALVDCWMRDRRYEETFPKFLGRFGILDGTADRTLQMWQKGFVQLSSIRTLLHPGARERVFKLFSNPLEAITRSRSFQSTDFEVELPTNSVSDARPMKATAAPALPSMESRPVALLPGSKIGRCLILEKLGEGTSGTVYRGFHEGFRIPVAVKVLRSASEGISLERREQMRREACLMAQINHPNILRVWDFNEVDIQPFVVMELVEGFTLGELIRQSGRLTLDRACRLMLQVIDGLAAAADLGIVHRDIKPANLLIQKDGKVKIADLGLACMTHGVDLDDGTNATTVGTIAYMSPEQAQENKSVDFRSDIYSLGATLYHALTGRSPFQGRTWTEVLLAHSREQPMPPTVLVPEIPVELSDLVLRMMAKSPENRFNSYAELANALRPYAEEPIVAPVTRGSYGSIEVKTNDSRSLWERFRGARPR